jgi:hypothetical protein
MDERGEERGARRCALPVRYLEVPCMHQEYREEGNHGDENLLPFEQGTHLVSPLLLHRLHSARVSFDGEKKLLPSTPVAFLSEWDDLLPESGHPLPLKAP